jgi:hypothetical protein
MKRGFFFCLVFGAAALPGLGQTLPGQDTGAPKPLKPEIFTNGFIDIMNNGQVNASARFIRIYIGEPGKLAVPVSIYSGVSANYFQNTGWANAALANQLINPLSGLINCSTDGVWFFAPAAKLTRCGLIYHLGGRVLTGYKGVGLNGGTENKPVNFGNLFGTIGLYLQTGAWERSQTKNMGICWFMCRLHWMYSNPETMQSFLQGEKPNGLYSGFSLGFGVEINSLVNLKVIYYKYIRPPELKAVFTQYQFSFQYALKNDK